MTTKKTKKPANPKPKKAAAEPQESKRERKKPERQPFLSKLLPKISTAESACLRLAELLDQVQYPELTDLICRTLGTLSELGVAATRQIPKDFIPIRKDRWEVEEGAIVGIKGDKQELYSVDGAFAAEVLEYGKICKIKALDDGSLMRVPRAHLELLRGSDDSSDGAGDADSDNEAPEKLSAELEERAIDHRAN